MSIDKIVIPKKFCKRMTMAKVAKSTTKPTRALVILAFALSSRALSPPDNIQETAPQISMKKKPTTPTTKRSPTTLGRNVFKKVPGPPKISAS